MEMLYFSLCSIILMNFSSSGVRAMTESAVIGLGLTTREAESVGSRSVSKTVSMFST